MRIRWERSLHPAFAFIAPSCQDTCNPTLHLTELDCRIRPCMLLLEAVTLVGGFLLLLWMWIAVLLSGVESVFGCSLRSDQAAPHLFASSSWTCANADVLEELLRACALYDVRNSGGETAYVAAVRAGQEEAAALLKARGSNPHFRLHW